MLYSLKTGAFCARVIPRRIGQQILGSIGYVYGMVPTKLHKRLISIHFRISPWMSKKQARKRSALVMRSYAQYWWDVFWLSSPRTKDEVDAIVTLEGLDACIETIRQAKEEGIGVIFALPHLGSWEIAGAWIAQKGYPPVVVAERLEPPELFELFTQTRTNIGMTVIAHDDSPTAKLLTALKNGEIICLVTDRDISRKGLAVDFFGAQKTFPVGAAALSLKTGAPIIPVCTYLSHDSSVTISFRAAMEGHVETSEDKTQEIERITQELARVYEDMIERDPAQWHVLYDEWEKS